VSAGVFGFYPRCPYHKMVFPLDLIVKWFWNIAGFFASLHSSLTNLTNKGTSWRYGNKKSTRILWNRQFLWTFTRKPTSELDLPTLFLLHQF